jgi:glyoxylase-like metal-dependent hydrolase (beta-lactamase superfamily II)
MKEVEMGQMLRETHSARRTTRWIVLIAIVGGGWLSTTAAGAQDGNAPKIVRMQTLNVRDILYILTGGGGNTLALMRDDGVVLIDTKLPGWGRSIRDTIEAVTDKPVTTIINTHAHADHTGGNVDFGTVPRIIAHQNTLANMQKMDAFKGADAKFLPNTIVTDRLSLLDGSDRIDLYYFGRGHTDGDLVVVFPEKRLAYLGDLFPAKAAPVIDSANGGSGVEFPKTLARAVAEIKGVNRVITGHDESAAIPRDAGSGSAIFANPKTMTWNDLQEYADFNREFLAEVEQAIKAGKPAAQAAATLQLPERYKAYDMQQARANVEAVYRELGK